MTVVNAGPHPPGPAPLVSVAISTFNRAHLIERAIRSALAQSFRDFELLVVDDGSTDATPAVLARIADPRLRTVRHERNGGISRTRNTAIRLARGEWIAFLDDDNEWAPDYLERQLAVARRRPAADVVYCRARRRDAQTGAETIMPADVFEEHVLQHLATWWYPIMSGALLRRGRVLEIGGLDERLRMTEDFDLWLRLAQRVDFAASSDVLVLRHMGHGAQLSRNLEWRAQDAVLMDTKWRSTLIQACGRAAYRRWRIPLIHAVGRLRARQLAEAGAGRQRLEALRRAAGLAPLLPESARHVAVALGEAILGPRASAWCRRRWGRAGAAPPG